MLIDINSFMRHRRRMLSLLAAALLTMALLATHSAATAGHHDHGEHSGMSTQTVLLLCMAVIEAGVAISLAVALAVTRRRPENHAKPSASVFAGPRPALAGTGPPGRRLALNQVFLR